MSLFRVNELAADSGQLTALKSILFLTSASGHDPEEQHEMACFCTGACGASHGRGPLWRSCRCCLRSSQSLVICNTTHWRCWNLCDLYETWNVFYVEGHLVPSLMVHNFGEPRLGTFQRLSPRATKSHVLVDRRMVCLKHMTESRDFWVVWQYRDHLEEMLHFTGEERDKPRDTQIICSILSHGGCVARDLNSDILSPSPAPSPPHSRFPTMGTEAKAVLIVQGHGRTI